MMGKHLHFLLVFLFFLLISFAQSQIEPNPQLEFDIDCSTSNDSCNLNNALCNSAGKCQCSFGWSREGNNSYCEPYRCDSSDGPSCSQLYKDPYAGCRYRECQCLDGFKLNTTTQKCELDNPNASPLGGSCVSDRHCGYTARCTTAGECRCPAGSIPETEFTCDQPRCSSTEECHTNVTANTVCDNYNNCRCQGPIFQQDPETFECVRALPDILPLGSKCKDSTYCGDGARCTTGSEPICKCKLGYLPTSDTGCEPVSCSKDEHCHKRVSPLTKCTNYGNLDWGYCRCKDNYYEDPTTNECSTYDDETPTPGWPEASTPGWPEPSTPGWPEPSTPVWPEASTPDWPEASTPGWPEPSTPGWPEPSTPGWPEAPTEGSTESSEIDESCGREKLYKSLWLKCEMRRPSCAAGSIDLQLKVKGYGSNKDPHSPEISPYEQN